MYKDQIFLSVFFFLSSQRNCTINRWKLGVKYFLFTELGAMLGWWEIFFVYVPVLGQGETVSKSPRESQKTVDDIVAVGFDSTTNK